MTPGHKPIRVATLDEVMRYGGSGCSGARLVDADAGSHRAGDIDASTPRRHVAEARRVLVYRGLRIGAHSPALSPRLLFLSAETPGVAL